MTTPYAAEAVSLIKRNYCPLPAPQGEKRPDLTTWSEWKDGRMPSPEQVAQCWPDDSAGEIGFVIPPGCCAFEIDGKLNSAHQDVDPEAQARALEGLRTAGALDALPCYTTPSGGRRYIGRLLRGWQRRRKKLAQEGLELFLAGDFVKCPPSAAYIVERPLPSVFDLPLMPAEVLALFEGGERETETLGPDDTTREAGAQNAATTLAGGFEMTADEFTAWREWLPDLRVTPSRGIALCPLHSDHEPSLNVYRDPRGYLRYHCRAECEGSRHEIKRNGQVVRVVRTGTLRRLKRLIAARRGLYPYDALRAHIRDLRLAANAEAIALAVVAVARERGLDPTVPLGISYRVLARQSELENVQDDGRLSGGGRRIRTALRAFRACGGFVEIGTSYEQAAATGRRARPTTIGLGALLPLQDTRTLPNPSTFDTTRTQTYSSVESEANVAERSSVGDLGDADCKRPDDQP